MVLDIKPVWVFSDKNNATEEPNLDLAFIDLLEWLCDALVCNNCYWVLE